MFKSIKERRKKRVRNKIKQNLWRSNLPRLTVFRSNKYISAQIINDGKKETLVVVSDKSSSLKGTKTERARQVGQILAKQALAQKIKKVVFDRGSYQYHGRVKALAEGVREEGLSF